MEIDVVGHKGGNALGGHAYTLTVTDIATGWTENRSVRNKARKWVIAALEGISMIMPFPPLGIDSDYADVGTTIDNGRVHQPPPARAVRHVAVSTEDKTIMSDVLAELNPALIQRQIQPTLTTRKAAAVSNPP